MKTNLLKKYWKQLFLLLFLSLNLSINFSPKGLSVGVKQTFAQEGDWNTGYGWLDDMLNADPATGDIIDNGYGIYAYTGSVWLYLGNSYEPIGNNSYIEDVMVYGVAPDNTPVDLTLSDVWVPDEEDDNIWYYWDYTGGWWELVNYTPNTIVRQISFAEGINSETVSRVSRDIIQQVMECAEITSLTITSTTRTPESQASAMYDNCENLGVANQKALYANAGDQVIDVYSTGKEASLSREQIISNMVSKINEVGSTNVSKHCADPSVLNVIDISPSSVSNQSAFENCLGSNSGISNYITPPTDPVYHVEIPQ